MYDEEKYPDENIEVEEWADIDDDNEFSAEADEEVLMLAPRILPGQEDRQHWQAESAYGIMSTTAEGAIGKLIKKNARGARTDEERFRDHVVRIAREGENLNQMRDQLLRLIPFIPDIKYKSPGAALFGLAAAGYIGKKLSSLERQQFNKILSQAESIKEKNIKVSPLDIVRYARMFKELNRSRR